MKLLFTLALTLLMSTQETQFKYVGNWEGALNIEAQNVKLPLVFKIREKEGKLNATMDSPDQGAYGMAFDKAVYEEGKLTLTMTQANGVFVGKLEEGKIVGTWTQNGMSFDLSMTKIVRKGKS